MHIYVVYARRNVTIMKSNWFEFEMTFGAAAVAHVGGDDDEYLFLIWRGFFCRKVKVFHGANDFRIRSF